MRRWRCTSRFDPWGKGVRTGPHRQFAKRYFYFGQKRAILYNRIGEMNSSGDVRQLQSEQFCRTNSHPARGHRRPPRFTAQFCAAKRGGCFFVKFWAVPDFFRNFSNCGSFCSFCIRIWTVFHWKFAQKSGRNFSVSGVFLCRIPCYNGSKSFHGGQQLRLREFLPL